MICLCLCWWLATGGMLFSGCLRVHVHMWSHTKLWTCVIKCLCEFHQIYNLGTVGDKDKTVIFWGHLSKTKIMTRPDMVKKALWEVWRLCVQTSRLQTTFLAKAYRLMVCGWGPPSLSSVIIIVIFLKLTNQGGWHTLED